MKSDGSGSWKGVEAGAGVGAGTELGRELGLDLELELGLDLGLELGKGSGGREILHFTASDLQIRFLVQNGVWKPRPKLEWLLGL